MSTSSSLGGQANRNVYRDSRQKRAFAERALVYLAMVDDVDGGLGPTVSLGDLVDVSLADLLR